MIEMWRLVFRPDPPFLCGEGRYVMIKEGSLTTNGWMFVVFLVLAITTPINPFINHRYFNILWYVIVALYALWILVRVVHEEEDA